MLRTFGRKHIWAAESGRQRPDGGLESQYESRLLPQVVHPEHLSQGRARDNTRDVHLEAKGTTHAATRDLDPVAGGPTQHPQNGGRRNVRRTSASPSLRGIASGEKSQANGATPIATQDFGAAEHNPDQHPKKAAGKMCEEAPPPEARGAMQRKTTLV